MLGFGFAVVYAFYLNGILLESRAEQGAAVVAPASVTSPAPASSYLPSKKKQTMKGKRIREKDTEGTEALNRFEADPVIKSEYQLNGVPLEVDPD